jgi:exopolysaccharide biosynthesis polyprenyl glycosylphosphotransferase
VFRKPLSDWRLVAKEIEDVTLGLLLLLFLAPLFAVVALAIKLDSPGPVFFRQRRYGLNNRLIGVYKFRTMHHHLRDVRAERLITRNDPRVTRVGAFLRKTSLDELPQLFNVLRGEMSIVGPRPHALSAKAADRLYEEVVAEYAVRHRVKPGITGWAQVNGWRGETDTIEKIQKRVEHDLYYVENWSLALDIKILLLTVFALLKNENAY